MKKKKAINKNKNDIKRFVLFFIMMICLIVSMSTYWVYAYHHKYGKTYFENNMVSYKTNDYVTVEGNTVHLKNINKTINDEFLNKQRNILNNNVLDITIKKGIYKNILSLKISYMVSKQSTNYEEILTLNIDLKNDKKVDNDELLKMIDKSYKSIATDIFNEHIKLSNNYHGNVIDMVTEREISTSEFNKNSEKYIIRIREKLPDVMTMYIENEEVYYVVKLSDINSVCYYTDNTNKILNNKIGEI